MYSYVFSATKDGDTLLDTVEAKTLAGARRKALKAACDHFNMPKGQRGEYDLGGFDVSPLSSCGFRLCNVTLTSATGD